MPRFVTIVALVRQGTQRNDAAIMLECFGKLCVHWQPQVYDEPEALYEDSVYDDAKYALCLRRPRP